MCLAHRAVTRDKRARPRRGRSRWLGKIRGRREEEEDDDDDVELFKESASTLVELD